ncbi:MAG: CoA transferase [Paracoccaceae bacterium]|nr:CoA transferase [Paracoccaceae bacterium]
MTLPHQPLQGMIVVEIGSSVAAPYAAWILASLGAEVVKVEPPETGDDARTWGRIFADDSSSFFQSMNRDKRSITIDLKDDAERDWLRTYCTTKADVVIQNMRPGAVEKYGLGAADLRAAKPGLVYCNLGAFGAVGPMRDQPGYDPLMQAFGGIMSVTGEDGRPPIRVGTSIVDMGTGLWCAIGILGALLNREKTATGCTVDASLYETAVAWMTTHVAMVQVDGRNPERQGSGARGMAPYQAYECSDGNLVISAPNDRLFKRLAEALGHGEWPDDARFASNQSRYKNLAALNERLMPIIAGQTRAHWQDVLGAAGIPCALVNSTTEMMAHEQTKALGIIQSLNDGGPDLMGMPLSFDKIRPPLRRRAPKLGEANADIKGVI